MKIFQTLIANPNDITYSGEDSNEKILYIFRKSFIINFYWILITLFLLVTPFFVVPSIPIYFGIDFIFLTTLFYYLFVFGYAFQSYTNWFFNVYIISDKKIVDVDLHGVSSKKISEAPIKSIEDVTSNIKGLIGMTFNIGNVYIQTAAESREFEFLDVDRPSEVRDLISDIASQVKEHKK